MGGTPHSHATAGAVKLYVLKNSRKILLGITLLSALTGCVGYVDGGYGGAVVVPGPDVIFSAAVMTGDAMCMIIVSRGGESRAAAHPAAAERRRGGEGGEPQQLIGQKQT